ncbi:MAG TPA: YraN family protein [Marmoricola sp.]|jgi:putative endonuclease|nr:YraN family protein [Marmoricola sp.]
MTAQQRRAIGGYGEAVAARHLVAQGMVLIDANWRCALGELDLVLRDGDTLVICEVKTRTTEAFGSPLEAVDETKLDRLVHLGDRWIAEHDAHPADVRVDLVSVLRSRHGAATVEHVRGVA